MSSLLKNGFTLATLFIFIFTLPGCASTSQPAAVHVKPSKRLEASAPDYQYNTMTKLNEDSEQQEKVALYAGLGTGIVVGAVGFLALLLASLPFMFAGHVPIG